MKSYAESEKWYRETSRVTPGGSQTGSKAPGRAGPLDHYPIYLQGGYGPSVVDVDGHVYLDFIASLAAVGLGHGDRRVVRDVEIALRQGALLSLPTVREFDASDALCDMTGWAQQARWVKTGSEATEAAVRIARCATGRERIMTVRSGYHCFSHDTELLTLDGFRKIEDIRIGDMLATRTPDGEMVYAPATATHVYDYHGEMVHFSSRSVDTLVTPNHRIVRGFRQGDASVLYGLDRADHAESLSTLTMTNRSVWVGRDDYTVRIESQKIAPRTIRKDRQRGFRTKGIVAFDSAAFVRWLGFYIAEGHCQRRKRAAYEVHVSQMPGPKRNQILALTAHLGFRAYETKTAVVFSSKELYVWLDRCGHGAAEKCVPREIKALSPRLLRLLLDGLVDGDGTRANGRVRKFYTTSRVLADDVVEIALKIGLSAVVNKRTNGVGPIAGKPVRSRLPIYHISLGRQRDMRVKAQRVRYDGIVRCVTVAPHHTVLARRNGRCVWSGNSWHSWFQAVKPEHPGVPRALEELITGIRYGDREDAMRYLCQKQMAAVILEPAPITGGGDKDWLLWLVETAHKYGTLVIFDEVVWGFRLAKTGGTGFFGVQPDVATYGKAMGNGVPVAAVVGKADVMHYANVISGTFGGDGLGLAAATAVIDIYQQSDVVGQMWALGEQFQRGIYSINPDARVRVTCDGYPVHPVLHIAVDDTPDAVAMTYFLQRLAEHGVLWHPAGGNIMTAHTTDTIDTALGAIERAIRDVNAAAKVKPLVDQITAPYQAAFARRT